MKNLTEIIANAEENKLKAFAKFENSKNSATTSAIGYYMDLSNAFIELLEDLKKLETK